MDLHKIYHPITATPFGGGGGYREYVPCPALAPYVRCFWSMGIPRGQGPDCGGETAVGQPRTCVVPDTCADILFQVDFGDNRFNSSFCGISDRPFWTGIGREEGENGYVFAIRFYAWGAVLFAEESLRETCNGFLDAKQHFGKIRKEMEACLFAVEDPAALVPAAESILLKTLRPEQENGTVMGTVSQILQKGGNLRIGELVREMPVGSRQMERLFREYVGVSPKKFCSLVRYQNLWRDIVCKSNQTDSGAQILDWVHKYGYADQAHLLRDFKKYHSMTVSQARAHACAL